MTQAEYILHLEQKLREKNQKFNDFYYDVLEAYGFDMTDPLDNPPPPNDLCALIAEQFTMLKTANDNYDQLKKTTEKYGTTIGQQSESLYNQTLENVRLHSELIGFKREVCKIFSLDFEETKDIDSIRLLEYLVDIVTVRKRIDERFKTLQDRYKETCVEIDALYKAMASDLTCNMEKAQHPAGVVSQISNMVAGMSMDRAVLEGDVKVLEETIEQMKTKPSGLFGEVIRKIANQLGIEGRFMVDYGYENVINQIKYLQDIIEYNEENPSLEEEMMITIGLRNDEINRLNRELKEFKDLKESYDIFKLNDNLGAILKRLEDAERARDAAVAEKLRIINMFKNVLHNVN